MYGHRKSEIIKVLEAVLFTGHFELENKPCVESALEDYKKSKADFADCLIGRKNRAMNCDCTYSFDRDLRGVDTFEVV